MFSVLSATTPKISEPIIDSQPFDNKEFSEMENDAIRIFKARVHTRDVLSWDKTDDKWAPKIYNKTKQDNITVKDKLMSSQLAIEWALRISQLDKEKPVEKKAMFEYVRLAFEKMHIKYLKKYSNLKQIDPDFKKADEITRNFRKANEIMDKFCSLLKHR
ncbi:MAG: hypothetical protein KR126chlam5_00572 [Candidatus Anoxychlamydiales bacterium]|nr:hypothetical protein [Candidatus Anoxychlamydiales bacterium]